MLIYAPQHTVSLSPYNREDAFMNDLAEYMAIRKQAMAVEKSLLIEHQLILNPSQLVGL